MDCILPGFSVHGILQARTLEWVAISFFNAWKWKVKVKSLSRVWLLATSWTAAYQAPPSMGFSGQQYWSGVPLPSPTTMQYWYFFYHIFTVYYHAFLNVCDMNFPAPVSVSPTSFPATHLLINSPELYEILQDSLIICHLRTFSLLCLECSSLLCVIV